MVMSSRKSVEDDLELMHREKQQKMNELDVVVPLRLHQVTLYIQVTFICTEYVKCVMFISYNKYVKQQ